MPFVYKLINKIDQTTLYIGSTELSLKKRMKIHRKACTQTARKNMAIYKKMNEIGRDNVDIVELQTFDIDIDTIQLRKMEDVWINKLDTINNGYNTLKAYDETSRFAVHYRKNREKILEYRREKIECECGRKVARRMISTHKKSKIHKSIVQNTM